MGATAVGMGLGEKLQSWLRTGGAGGRGRRATVLVLGLDGAGKSRVLAAIAPPHRPRPRPRDRREQTTEDDTPQPTLAAQHQHTDSHGVSIGWCDVSGVSRHRALWERHYRRADALVFVVDAADHLRLVVAREELQLALQHPAIASRRLPLLVLANKSDQPNALPAAAIANALGLECVRDKPWHVESCSAVSGVGLDSGVAWLARGLRAPLPGNGPHL